MTHPTDAAIAQAFREFVAKGYNEIFPCEIEDRARELDAAKGGEGGCERCREWTTTMSVGDGNGQLFVHGPYDAIKACQHKLIATPPAQAAESVQVASNSAPTLSKEAAERVARAIAETYLGKDYWPEFHRSAKAAYYRQARAAIAAMREGE